MAKQELRISVQKLLEEKASLEKQIITIRDKKNGAAEQLAKLRQDQFSYREAKQTLASKDVNKHAKMVLDKQITECQLKIDPIQKELELHDQEYDKVNGTLKNIANAIKELEGA